MQEKIRPFSSPADEQKTNEAGNVPNQEAINIADPDEARETIAEDLKHGVFPVISVPERYVESVRVGIRPNTTWIGERIIAGTIGRNPYMPPGERRLLFRIHTSAGNLEPRFTGPDHHFHGIVAFRGPIGFNELEEIT